jgi:D-alanyl-D-alanine carboxypeptidase
VRKAPCLAVYALLCAVGIAFADAQVFPDIDRALDSFGHSMPCTGSMTISKHGSVIYSRNFGTEARSSGLEGREFDERYKVGSITKIFTSVIVLQLVEEGLLSLDDKLGRFFPSMPNSGRISVSELLSHRSGIGDIVESPGFRDFGSKPETREALIDRLSRLPSDFEPGSEYRYSNSNYLLLGLILERVCDKEYPEILQDRISNRIGLRLTAAGSGGAPLVSVADYSLKTDPSVLGGAGSVVSTTRELALFIESLFSGKLISASSLGTMTRMRDGYGCGIARIEYGGHEGYGHSGMIDDYRAGLFYFPSEGIGVAYCIEGSFNSAIIKKHTARLTERVFAAVLGN